jgi:hypothetical protein
MRKKLLLKISILLFKIALIVSLISLFKNNNTTKSIGFIFLAVFILFNIINGLKSWDDSLNNIDREKEKWSRQKSMGGKKFVLIYGVLSFGGISSVVYCILTILLNSNSTKGIPVNVITFSIITGLGGIFVGVRLWNANARKFENK